MSTCGVWMTKFAGSPITVGNLSDLNLQHAAGLLPYIIDTLSVLLVWKPALFTLRLLIIIM